MLYGFLIAPVWQEDQQACPAPLTLIKLQNRSDVHNRVIWALQHTVKSNRIRLFALMLVETEWSPAETQWIDLSMAFWVRVRTELQFASPAFSPVPLPHPNTGSALMPCLPLGSCSKRNLLGLARECSCHSVAACLDNPKLFQGRVSLCYLVQNT